MGIIRRFFPESFSESFEEEVAREDAAVVPEDPSVVSEDAAGVPEPDASGRAAPPDPLMEEALSGITSPGSNNMPETSIEARIKAVEAALIAGSTSPGERVEHHERWALEFLHDRLRDIQTAVEKLDRGVSDGLAHLQRNLQESERARSIVTSRLVQQSDEVKALVQSVQGARVGWERTQEELAALRDAMSQHETVLRMLGARLELQGREVEAISQAQARMGEVVSELPKTLSHELQGSELMEQARALNSLTSGGDNREKILLEAIRAARSAFLKVHEELKSMQGLLSARDQAVLRLLDGELERMQLQQLENQVDELRRGQGELAGAMAQLPATVAQQIEGSEQWERLRSLLTSSSREDSPAEALMETLKGTMSAWVTMQKEMNEIRDLIASKDEAAPTKEIGARMGAIEARQQKLASSILELPEVIRREVDAVLVELRSLPRGTDHVRQNEKLLGLLSSTLAEKAQEKRLLLNTVEGAREAFFRVQEAVAEMREFQASRDKAVVEELDSRMDWIQTRWIDAWMQDGQEVQGKVSEALSDLTTTVRQLMDATARVVTERVSGEAAEIRQSVKSLPEVILSELSSPSDPSTPRRGQKGGEESAGKVKRTEAKRNREA